MKMNDVLLGLIKLHPGVSGYELRKIICQSTQYFANAQLSQIYPALGQMTKGGLLSFEEKQTDGGRKTKCYHLTETGEEQLLTSLREPINYTLSMNSVRLCMLRITFIGLLSQEEQESFLRDALDYFRFERNELMSGHIALESEYLDSKLAQSTDLLQYWGWEIDYILKAEDRLIAWLETVLTKIQETQNT